MSEELKPCPFCGGTAYVSEGYTTNEGAWPHGTFYRVYCGSCQLRQLFHRTALAATAAWNRRTVSGQEAQPICAHCNGTDVELLRLCHNSSCSAYAREESFYKGWEDNAAPIPATEQDKP